MAFPSTPTNGQIAVVGGIAYQYATTPNSWSRILSSANVITANSISANFISANTFNINNAFTAPSISTTGNVTGNYFIGNGSQLTGIAGGGGASIANGTSNITLASSGGNATVNIGGTANVAVFAASGEYVTGVISATGNVTGGNVLTGGLISATGALSVTGATTLTTVSTGNISAGNVYSGGSITTGGLISATGNVTGGNVVTSGLISATGNVSSGAAVNTVNLSVSGNVLGNLLPSANITYNLGSPTQRWNTLYLAGNTIELGAQSISATATGLSVGNNPVVTVSSTGTSNTTGNMNVIGNVTGSNVTSTGLLSATGNVTGGNILTGGLISATGNVTANNGMFTTSVNTASFTGAVVSVTGNVTGGNVSGTLLTGTLATAAQANITSVGTLGALAVSGNVTAGNVTAGSGVSVASGSILFNGTSQYLSAPSNTAYAFGTGDFTVESWIIQSDATGNRPICQSDVLGNSSNDKWWFALAGGGLFFGTHNAGGFSVVTSTSFTLGTWYHVAVTRASGVMKMFINGVSTAFTTSGTPSGYSLSQNGMTVGAMSTPSYWSGYISNLRIVKGVAVYTSAFTPSTTPLTSTQLANVNGTPSAAITGTSTSLLLNTPNNSSFLTDSSTNGFTVTNVGTATSQAAAPFAVSFTTPAGPLTSTQSVSQNGNPSAAITGTSTSLLLNTQNGPAFLVDGSTNNATITNTGSATTQSSIPFSL